MMNTQIEGMLSGSNNYSEKNSARQGVRSRWGGSVQGRLHGGGDIGAEAGIRKEKEAGKRAASSRKTIPQRVGPHPWGNRGTQPPKRLCWAERLADVPELSESRGFWLKGGNKQAYHGTDRQDSE